MLFSNAMEHSSFSAKICEIINIKCYQIYVHRFIWTGFTATHWKFHFESVSRCDIILQKCCHMHIFPHFGVS